MLNLQEQNYPRAIGIFEVAPQIRLPDELELLIELLTEGIESKAVSKCSIPKIQDTLQAWKREGYIVDDYLERIELARERYNH